MPNHLPPVTQILLGGLQQARAEQIVTLSKLLDLSIGTPVSATVEKIAPVTQSQRNLLLNQNSELLAQLQSKAGNPAAKAQITTLIEQQPLLNAALLKLVQLRINGRALLTYTDTAVAVGQTIPVKLDALQRLMQLAPSISTHVSGGQAADQLQPSGEQAKLQSQTMLAALLRTLLPQKDKPLELFSALPHLQRLPAVNPTQSLSTQLLPATIQQALKTLADQLRTPQQLSNPILLPMILKNSGVQFEQKLAANLAKSIATPSAVTQSPVTHSPVTHSPAKSPNNRLVAAALAQPLNPTLVNRLTTQDLKGALLQLLHRINQELAGSSPPPIGSNYTATQHNRFSVAMPSGSTPLPYTSLMQFIQELPLRSQTERNDKVLRTQLMLLLHQHTLSGLAKIQLQQVHAVNHQQTQTESIQPTQSWLFEIPVRHGQDVQQLEVRIDQQWVDEEQNEKTTKKIRQWSVMLSFNLLELGGFYAQLTILDDSVSAKLWADQEATLQHAQQKLEGLRQQLQAQGVEVKQLQCLSGAPPNRSISLNYALVDITT